MVTVGRPRKHYYPSQTESTTLHDEAISNEVEKMYQEALQLTRNEILAGQTEGSLEDVGAAEFENKEVNASKDTTTAVTQTSETENTEKETGNVDEENEKSKLLGHSHRMTTRGKRVPVYNADFEGGKFEFYYNNLTPASTKDLEIWLKGIVYGGNEALPRYRLKQLHESQVSWFLSEVCV